MPCRGDFESVELMTTIVVYATISLHVIDHIEQAMGNLYLI